MKSIIVLMFMIIPLYGADGESALQAVCEEEEEGFGRSLSKCPRSGSHLNRVNDDSIKTALTAVAPSWKVRKAALLLSQGKLEQGGREELPSDA